jgi:hypothetical protein
LSRVTILKPLTGGSVDCERGSTGERGGVLTGCGEAVEAVEADETVDASSSEGGPPSPSPPKCASPSDWTDPLSDAHELEPELPELLLPLLLPPLPPPPGAPDAFSGAAAGRLAEAVARIGGAAPARECGDGVGAGCTVCVTALCDETRARAGTCAAALAEVGVGEEREVRVEGSGDGARTAGVLARARFVVLSP